MDVYLSSPSTDEPFINAVLEAVDRVKKLRGEDSVRLVYPPRKMPEDKRRVEWNFAQLLDCDVVIFNMSPEVVQGRDFYNPGVVIEYGMVFALDRTNLPWQGNWPVPIHKVYCHKNFPKSNLTQPIPVESVEGYERTEEGYEKLVASIVDFLTSRASYRLNRTAALRAEFQLLGNVYQGPWIVKETR